MTQTPTHAAASRPKKSSRNNRTSYRRLAEPAAPRPVFNIQFTQKAATMPRTGGYQDPMPSPAIRSPDFVRKQRLLVAEERKEHLAQFVERMNSQSTVSRADHRHMLRILVTESLRWRAAGNGVAASECCELLQRATSFEPEAPADPALCQQAPTEDDPLDVSESMDAFYGVLEDIDQLMATSEPKDMYRQVATNMHQLGLFRPHRMVGAGDQLNSRQIAT